MLGAWWKWSSDLSAANIEAHRVINLRMAKLAKGGPAAALEAQRMVTEKVEASVEAGMSLALGKAPHAVLRRYRVIMRANVKRLRAGR
jgi:hypothetical protein